MEWNYNLVVTFIFRLSFSISQGVWNSGTGANYIFYLEDHSNTLVGVVQAIQGLFIPAASFPAGYFADRFSRDSVLKCFGGTGFTAIALTILAVLVPKHQLGALHGLDSKYVLLCVAFCFWGITQGGNPIVETILADSVPTGSRSYVYTALFFVGALGMAIGPLMGAVVFMMKGNVWTVDTLGMVVIAGMLLSIIPSASFFFFDDRRTLGAESEAHRRQDAPQDSTESKAEEEREEASPSKGPSKLCGMTEAAIPYILTASDIIFGLASGCTIKFFPVFFAEKVKLDPVAVNILMAAQPVMIGLISIAGQRLSGLIGRIEVLLLLRLVGFSMMGVMGFFPALWSNAPLIVSIYLLRTGVNNAGYPIQKSVLMDHVPKKQRGRWSAVDSIYMFGWSGSAFIGGIIVDHAGFDWCFLITAIAQCLGWAVMIPLLALVPHHEKRNEMVEGGVQEPLLAPDTSTNRDAEAGLLQIPPGTSAPGATANREAATS